MNRVTIIGAGKTGRGFLADITGGCELTFIDKNKALTESLNSGNGYKISYFGGGKPAKRVNCVRAETWETVSHIDAGLIFVSVGGSNLADAGKELRKHISAGQRIIVCENAFHPAKTLYEAIGIDGVRISESTVFCTTIDNGGIDILSEGYPYLQFDALPMDGNIPQINGLKPIKDFGNFLARKLFTYNNASCVIAYLGYIKGCTVYSDAANDTEILALLDRNYEVINRCMCREFGYDETGQSEFAVLSRKKFTDRTIVDTVVRNACEPQRKLKKDERIIAPLLLADKYGEDTSTLILTAAAALLYSDAADTEWEKLKKDYTPSQLLVNICGLNTGTALHNAILEKYDYLKIILKNRRGDLLFDILSP